MCTPQPTRREGSKPTAAEANTFEDILEDLGKQMLFITIEKELGQAAKDIPKAEKRSVVMRAFLGGLNTCKLEESVLSVLARC